MRPRPFTTFEPRSSIPTMSRVGRIPLTLMRSTLVTRDPDTMAEALQDYEDGTPPVAGVLPWRAQNAQWKSRTYDTAYSGASRARYDSATGRVGGLMEALVSGKLDALTARSALEDRINGHAERLYTQADGSQFPSAPFDQSPVLMRDAPAYGRPVSLPGLTRDADIEPMQSLPARVGGQGIQRALQVHRTNQGTVLSYMLTMVRHR